MRLRTLVVAVVPFIISSPVVSLAAGQGLPTRERWIAVDPPRAGWPVSMYFIILGPDSVMENPIPNPSQGEPRWRVSNGRLETWPQLRGDTMSQEFTLSGDTMRVQGPRGMRQMYRVAHGPAGQPPITGTWETGRISNFSLVYYLTYRSDGRVIQDISSRDSSWWKGDSLVMRGRGVRHAYAFRKSADTMYVTGPDGQVQRFARKPWGCYNTDRSDRGVLECQ